MKFNTLISIIVILFIANSAISDQYCDECWLGLRANLDGTGDELLVTPWAEYEEAYLFLHVNPDHYAMGVSFRIVGWPESPGYPIGTSEWLWPTSFHVWGQDHEEGHDVVFDGEALYPDENGNILIATARFMSFDPSWPGEVTMWIGRALWNDYMCDEDLPIFVMDPNHEVVCIQGQPFTVRSVPPTATNEASFSLIRALY